MKVHAPFIIGPRLLVALKVADATISLDCVPTPSGRVARPVFLIDIDGQEFTVRDLRGPAYHGGTFQSIPEAYEALLGFMDACGESVRYTQSGRGIGDNTHLFEKDLAEWCGENCGLISYARFSLLTEESANAGGDEVDHSLIEG